MAYTAVPLRTNSTGSPLKCPRSMPPSESSLDAAPTIPRSGPDNDSPPVSLMVSLPHASFSLNIVPEQSSTSELPRTCSPCRIARQQLTVSPKRPDDSLEPMGDVENQRAIFRRHLFLGSEIFLADPLHRLTPIRRHRCEQDELIAITGFGRRKRRLQHGVQDLHDRRAQLRGLGATGPGTQGLVLLQQILLHDREQVLTVTEVQEFFGEFYRSGAFQCVAEKASEALTDAEKRGMIDRRVRLSPGRWVRPERVEVERKPLGQSQVFFFGQENGRFGVLQRVLIDVSSVGQHVLFGGGPEARDE